MKEKYYDSWGKYGWREPVRDPRDKYGIYPSYMEHELKADKPYSYPEFYRYQNNSVTPNATDYSDRLWEWDHEKYDRCMKEAAGDTAQIVSHHSAEKLERFLQLYHECDELKLSAIVEGCNVSNGYPYFVYKYYNPNLDD